MLVDTQQPGSRNTGIQLLLQAGLIQLMAAIAAGLLGWWLNLSVGMWIILGAVLSALLTYRSTLPPWWIPIQLVFIPAMALVSSLGLPAWLFLLLFIILFAIFGGVYRSRVPLYVSGDTTCAALCELMPAQKNFYFLDIGSGTGHVLAYLDRRFAFGMFHGVETAWLPFIVSWLRSKARLAQFVVMRRNLWDMDFSRYDVVYAFLSPQPMAELWQKVCAEMKPGSLFISNSFAAPGHAPDKVVALDTLHGGELLLWQIPDTAQGSTNE